MLPAPAELRSQVRWRIDGRDVGPDAWIGTSYLNRGQDRNLRIEGVRLVGLEIRVPRRAFEALFSLAYDPLAREEREDTGYAPGEDDAADRLRALGFPSFPDLLAAEPGFAFRLVLAWETELLDLLSMDEGPWRADNFFVHELTSARIDGDDVVLRGTALASPEHNAVKLRNLLHNLRDPLSSPEIVVASIRQLARGHRHALPALPTLEALAEHGDPRIAAEAEAAADAIRRHAE